MTTMKESITADSKKLNQEVDELWTLLLMLGNDRPEASHKDIQRQAQVVADLAKEIGEKYGKGTVGAAGV